MSPISDDFLLGIKYESTIKKLRILQMSPISYDFSANFPKHI